MITITDIAAKAGVARSTVSYVLNENNTKVRISDETRRRVTQAAKDLGYRRNELARAVTTGKNSVLGFWVMNADRESDVRILAGAMKEAQANNYFIKMLSLDSSGDASQIAEQCIDWRLSGIIAINASSEVLDQVQPQVGRFDIPVVMVEGEGPRPGCLHVTSEQERGIEAAVRHLAALGHRRIAFLAGTPLPDKREQAYRKTMRALKLTPFIEVVYSYWNYEPAHQAALKLLKRRAAQRPTAVCCVCDHVAMILISTAGELGLHVPQELSVTGFDDLAVSAIYNPPLTTVVQPFEEMGRAAVRRLLGLVDKTQASDGPEERLPTRLIVRGSTLALNTALNEEAMRDTIIENGAPPFSPTRARAPNAAARK